MGFRIQQWVLPLGIAMLHGILAMKVEVYGAAFCGLPAAAVVMLDGAITGHRYEAEYFIGRMVDIFPYVVLGESLVVFLIGLFLVRRSSRRHNIRKIVK